MNNRSNAAAILAYITWIGWFVALFIRDKDDDFTTLHMNQALVLNIISILGGVLAYFPLLGGIVSRIVSAAVLICAIIGLVRAITWNDEPLPIIGEIRLFN